MQYSQLDEESGDDSLSLTIDDPHGETSSLRTTTRVNPELSEPLTSSSSKNDLDDSENDPFYVFREDLYRKLELVDEGLSRYLRIVHQTVSNNVHVVCVVWSLW